MTLLRNVPGPAPTAAPPALAARAVAATKTYGKGDGAVVALDHVDMAFAAGAFTAIMGPSGSGKSTLLAGPFRTLFYRAKLDQVLATCLTAVTAAERHS